MALAFLGNSPLQEWGILDCNFEDFYFAENKLAHRTGVGLLRSFALSVDLKFPDHLVML